MKLDSGRSTDFLTLPVEEAERTIEAMKLAEETNDIEALKWCARRIVWLDETAEIIGGDDAFFPAHIFNKAWGEILKAEPPPASIAGIIAKIDQAEPITAATAGKAIETLKEYFEENMGGKTFRAVCTSLNALREAVKKSEFDE